MFRQPGDKKVNGSLIGSLAAALGGVVIAGCGGSSLAVSSLPVASPTTTTTSTTTSSTTDPSADAHAAQLARGSLQTATLDVDSGITSLNIRAANIGDRLITALTPAASGQQPSLGLTSPGTVHLQFVAAGGSGGASAAMVTLNPGVLWTIVLDGGAAEESVDMRAGRLATLDLAAGTSRATIKLPGRPGTQTIRENGGAQRITVLVPRSVAIRARVTGGAGSVQLRGATHTGVGGASTFTDPGFSTAGRRLALNLIGGISQLVVRSP